MDLGVFKTMLFFGPLLAFLVWQYLSVSRTLEDDSDGTIDDD